MEMLAVSMPDFTRMSWVSEEAKQTWEPRLKRIADAWSEVEWRSVASSVRRCALTVVGSHDFVSRAGRWAEHGLNAMPLEIQGLSQYSYASTNVREEAGKPFAYRIVLGKPPNVTRFKRAFDAHDDAEMARLLGYPSCCSAFFRNVWVDRALVDTTWSMAEASGGRREGERWIEIDGPDECNILWRWMGVRAVPHMPCRFDCARTLRFAGRLLDLACRSGYGREMAWLREILSWPVEWSALHGIAEIKTPILRVATRTIPTAQEHVVRRQGHGFPSAGTRGVGFP